LDQLDIFENANKRWKGQIDAKIHKKKNINLNSTWDNSKILEKLSESSTVASFSEILDSSSTISHSMDTGVGKE